MASGPQLLDHWKAGIDGLDVPPDLFYATLEANLDAYGVAEVKRGVVMKKEGGWFSNERPYFRVLYDEYLFDICCARFGSGSFVSWWCYHFPASSEFLTGIPLLDEMIACFRSPTHYREDTASMFRDWVKKVVNETIEMLTATSGVQLLAEAEHKPLLEGLYED